MTPHKQIDHTSLRQKIDLRQWAIAELGGLDQTRVLELFGGTGVLYDACYHGAAEHLSIDCADRPGTNRLQGDNRILLPSVMETEWNLFDADSYSNPWAVLTDVCRLREPGRFLAVVTCGILRGLKNGYSNAFIRTRIGFHDLRPAPLLNRWYDDVIRWVLHDWNGFQITVERAVRITPKRFPPSEVTYWGLILRKE